MNLIEELKKSLWKNAFIGQAPEYIKEVHSEVMKEIEVDVKDILPIFAEWIRGIGNPYEKRNNTDISYGKEKGFDKAIDTILSELENMKNPVNIGGK